MTEYLRMSGVYWGLTVMDLMNSLDKMKKEDVLAYVIQCQDKQSGGIAASVNHDPHLLYTLSAVQVRHFFRKNILVHFFRMHMLVFIFLHEMLIACSCLFHDFPKNKLIILYF